MQIKVTRIFNTYGPRMHPNDGRVVANMIVQSLNGEGITIYGNGNQTRSFQFIDDLIEGIVRVMHTDSSFIGPINIGNPYEISILNLAKIIINKVKSSSNIIFKELPNDDPERRCPDISLARKVLTGWNPQIGINEGLERTIAYFHRLNTEKYREHRFKIK